MILNIIKARFLFTVLMVSSDNLNGAARFYRQQVHCKHTRELKLYVFCHKFLLIS